jgi:putative ABC transport system permease protein
MRMLDYVWIAGKEIKRQPIRSLLTVMALTISTTILVTLLSISLGARQSIIQGLGLTTSLNAILVTPNQSVTTSVLGGSVQVANEKAARIDDAAVQDIASLPHVLSAYPTVGLWELKTFTVADHPKTFVSQTQGTGANASAVQLQEGRFFSGADAHEVILGWSYAKEMGFTEATVGDLIGKTVTFTTQPAYRGEGATIPTLRSSRAEQEAFTKKATTITATIVGVTQPAANDNQLLVPMNWARNIKATQTYNTAGTIVAEDQIAKNGYSTVVVIANSNTAVGEITATLAEKGYGFTSTQQQIERINSLTTIMWGLFGSIALVSLIAACLGIANTMLTTISEQRFVIGVWRAAGARKRVIAWQFISQSAMLGLLGGIMGVIAGWAASRWISQYVMRLLEEQKLPPLDVVQISPVLMLGCVLAATLLAVLAGLYPAIRASRTDPSQVLSSGQ